MDKIIFLFFCNIMKWNRIFNIKIINNPASGGSEIIRFILLETSHVGAFYQQIKNMKNAFLSAHLSELSYL